MHNIYIKLTNKRIWIIDYNTACAMFFVPVTIYGCYKLRKRKLKKNALERQRKIEELQELYQILKIAGSPFSSVILLQILLLRGGDDVIIPGIRDCLNLEKPSYVDDERILRFLNDKFSKFDINGIIYITKEAFCYLVGTEGLVDFPIIFLERVKIAGLYLFLKRVAQWGVASVGAMAAAAGLQTVVVISVPTWILISCISIEVFKPSPSVKEIDQLTGKFVQRISGRKDSVVFDAKKEPLPPVMEDSIKPVKIGILETEYEITEPNLVDVAKVSQLDNKFSDVRLKRPNNPSNNKKRRGKAVYFIDKINEWAKNSDPNEESENIIDKMLKEEII